MTGSTGSTCRIELFGGLCVYLGDQVITRFTTKKYASLLAYLAYKPHKLHSRDILVELLWPDVTLQAGRASLNSALTSLRHQVEAPGFMGSQIILSDRETVRLNADVITTDVAEFETIIHAASHASSPTERIRHLTDALELYRDGLLPKFYEDWVQAEQRRLTEVYHRAVHQLITYLVQAQAYDVALRYAHRALTIDPLREEAHLELMRLYVSMGQPAAALRQFHELERLLFKELNCRPSTAVCKFVREIVVNVAPMPVISLASAPHILSVITIIPPSGTVTFLATDIDEAKVWREAGEQTFKVASSRCQEVLRPVFSDHGGYEVRNVHCSFLVAFAHVSTALMCAVECQKILLANALVDKEAIAMKMALHTGDVIWEKEHYDGASLQTVGRMVVAAHGGQIICSQTIVELLRLDLLPDVRFVDLGLCRLRGVNTPERLFQIAHPDLPREFPTLNAEAGYQNSLPVQLTRFFGREQEIARLQDVLLTQNTRLITLTGPGGSGKTRLSQEVVRRVLEPFLGAVWFVPLADIAEARMIAGAVIAAMRLPCPPTIEHLDQAVDALSRQPSLLVLDNFEHLVDDGTDVVETLLARVQSLTCLVTSRQALALYGEHEIPLNPLPTPHGAITPEAIALNESVQLFVNRAQASRPDFQVTSHNAAAIAELCVRLDGIPLAIELAAARVQDFTPGQMLVGLVQNLDILRSRKRNIAERQRTMSNTIEWSYKLLTPDAQLFFRQLSVFRGGYTLVAAEAIRKDRDLEKQSSSDCLTQLQDCSLIVTDTNVGQEGYQKRFRLLETFRQYGQEQLSVEEGKYIQRHHAEYFLRLAEEAEPHLQGETQVLWLDRLETEWDNLRVALEWSLSTPDILELGLRLVSALGWFWVIRGPIREGRNYLTALVSKMNDSISSPLRAKALEWAGTLAEVQNDCTIAQPLLEKSLVLYQDMNDKSGIATILRRLGNIAYAQKDYPLSLSLIRTALSYCQEVDFKPGIAAALNNLGNVLYALKDYDGARAHYEQSLIIKRDIQDRRGMIMSLNNLGDFMFNQGDYVAADGFYMESLAISRKLKVGIVPILFYRGNAAYGRKDFIAAEAFYTEGLLRLSKEKGAEQHGIGLLERLGHLNFDNKKMVMSATLYGAAEALRQSLKTLSVIVGPADPNSVRQKEGLRTELGERVFSESWKQGFQMSLNEAVAFALKSE